MISKKNENYIGSLETYFKAQDTMKYFVTFILVLSMGVLSYSETVTIPAGFCDLFVLNDITEIQINVESVDGSLFTAVLLPGVQDSCPGILSGNMLMNCNTVLKCNTNLGGLNGNYTFFVVNDNIIEDGYFDITISDTEGYLIYVICVILLIFLCCACNVFIFALIGLYIEKIIYRTQAITEEQNSQL